jgi:hypothetical protein
MLTLILKNIKYICNLINYMLNNLECVFGGLEVSLSGRACAKHTQALGSIPTTPLKKIH